MMLLLLVANLAWDNDCDSPKPRCTSLITSGTFRGQTFVPNADCYMAVPTRTDIHRILQAKWLVVHGGSNAMILFVALANAVEARVTVDIDVRVMGTESEFLDIVWRVDDDTGNVTRLHRRYAKGKQDRIRGKRGTPLHEITQRLTSEVPEFGNSLIRLSFTRTDLYPAAFSHLDGMVAGAGSWRDAHQILYHQIGQWYLWGSKGDGHSVDQDLASYVDHAKPYCNTRGHDCFFATVVKADVGGAGANMATGLQNRMASAGSGFHYFNFISLARANPSELLEAHMSPFIGLWAWWILFNSLPSAVPILRQSAQDVGCLETAQFGGGCVVYDHGKMTMGSGCHDCNCHSPFSSQLRPADCASARHCAFTRATGRVDAHLAPPPLPRPPLALPPLPRPPHAPPTPRPSPTLPPCPSPPPKRPPPHRPPCPPLSPPPTYTALLLAQQLRACHESQPDLVFTVAEALSKEEERDKDGDAHAMAVLRYPLALLSSLAVCVCLLYRWHSDRRRGDKKSKQVAAQPTRQNVLPFDNDAPIPAPVATIAPDPAKKLARGDDLFTGLNAARLLASIHVVLGHLYQSGAVRGVYLYSWGFVRAGETPTRTLRACLTTRALCSKTPRDTD